MNTSNKTLNINEIFHSIQGEGTRSGLPCVFVRLQGCMLRCSWCDTAYALELNQIERTMGIDEIISEIKKYDCNFVELTGGEPLAQPYVHDLMSALCDLNYTVAIETNGHSDISKVDSRVSRIMDLKCPDSKMSKFNNYKNIDFLNKNDEVKFVVASVNDFSWAIAKISEFDLISRVSAVLVSPAFGLIEPIELSKMILDSGLAIRMQIQIHKYIWHPNTRGV